MFGKELFKALYDQFLSLQHAVIDKLKHMRSALLVYHISKNLVEHLAAQEAG